MATDDIEATLLVRRGEAYERLLASKLAQEVRKLETAYVALSGVRRPDFLFETPAGDLVVAEAKGANRRSGPRAGSVRGTMQGIIERGPELWDYDELATALEAEGVDVRAPDGKAKSSLRTAVWTLVNEGIARRGPGSTIYAVQFHDELLRLGALGINFASDEGEEVG